MRLALVCPDDLSTLLFCKGLIKFLEQDRAIRLFTISPVGDYEDYEREVSALGSTHIPIEMCRFINPLSDLRYLLSLYRVFRRYKIDAVINWTTKPNIYGSIAAKLAQVKTIMFAVRGLGSAFLNGSDLQGRILEPVVSTLYRLAGRVSHKVWFTNQNDMQYFLSQRIISAEKAFLTKNAVNIEDFSLAAVSHAHLSRLRQELGLAEQDRVVIMVARMIWSKGIREFVEAAHHLRTRLPQVKAILVGPIDQGSPHTVPESYLREQEKSDNFRWLGFRRDVKELYALSDLAVLPSYYKEGGYPRALLEPMALGKPVITTDLPDCRGPVAEGQNGYLVPPRDAQALSQAIEELMRDDAKRARFGECSRRKIEREFDERQVVQKVVAELFGAHR